MLTETQPQGAHDSVALRGIRTWHISAPSASQVVHYFGGLVKAINPDDDFDAVKGVTQITGAWSDKLLHWTQRGDSALPRIARHSHATWSDTGWSEDDFNFGDNEEPEPELAGLTEKYADIDGTGHAPHDPGHCDDRPCDLNDPKHRSRVRHRLHRTLDKSGWSCSLYAYDAPLRSGARTYVPPGFDFRATMGPGFRLGDSCSGGSFAMALTLDDEGNVQIGQQNQEQHTYAPIPEPEFPAMPEATGNTVVSGPRIEVTGRLEGVQCADLERLIAARGATVAKSVIRKTDHFVAYEKPSSKLEEARECGGSKLAIAEVRRMLAAATALTRSLLPCSAASRQRRTHD